MAKTKRKDYELDAVQFDPAQLPLPEGVMSAANAATSLIVPVPPGTTPPTDVWYVRLAGKVVEVHAGDWIVTDPNSIREFLTPEVFNTKYDPPKP